MSLRHRFWLQLGQEVTYVEVFQGQGLLVLWGLSVQTDHQLVVYVEYLWVVVKVVTCSGYEVESAESLLKIRVC